MHNVARKVLQWVGNKFAYQMFMNKTLVLLWHMSLALLLPVKFWYCWNFQVGPNNIIVYFSRWKRFFSISLFCNSFICICICTGAWSKSTARDFWNIRISFFLSWNTPNTDEVHFGSAKFCQPNYPSGSANHMLSWKNLSSFAKRELAKIVFADMFGQQAQILFKRPSNHKTCHKFSFAWNFMVSLINKLRFYFHLYAAIITYFSSNNCTLLLSSVMGILASLPNLKWNIILKPAFQTLSHFDATS
jgi:hypothetical protein